MRSLNLEQLKRRLDATRSIKNHLRTTHARAQRGSEDADLLYTKWREAVAECNLLQHLYDTEIECALENPTTEEPSGECVWQTLEEARPEHDQTIMAVVDGVVLVGTYVDKRIGTLQTHCNFFVVAIGVYPGYLNVAPLSKIKEWAPFVLPEVPDDV